MTLASTPRDDAADHPARLRHGVLRRPAAPRQAAGVRPGGDGRLRRLRGGGDRPIFLNRCECHASQLANRDECPRHAPRQVIKLLSPDFVHLTSKAQQLSAAFRGAHERVATREEEIGGSGGSLGLPGPLLTHLHTAYMVYFERLPTRLNPLPG